MSSDNQAEVIFKVENIQSAKVFSAKDYFFKEELEQAKQIIKKLLTDIKEFKNNENRIKIINEDNHFHQHNSLSVLGARGMGKTSFMLSLQSYIIKENDEINNQIIWLPHLDPTRMEENETFLVTVVANILKKIRTDYQKGDLNQDIQDKLRSLSHDFAVLAPQQVHQDQWKDLVGDPDSFAYEVLNKAHSGLSLARSFHEFLRVCLKLCGDDKLAFIQPIDDVDSAIGQGWPILETVRKYLATPYMITILSGDIDLYDTLIKKQQFDKIKHLLASEDMREIKKQVGQLTEQYLSKVMPFHLRVRLMPLTHRIMERAIHDTDFISLKFDSESANKPLSEIYRDLIIDLFNYHIPEGSIATSILKPEFAYVRFLPDNLRDLIQLFKVFEYWYNGKPEKSKRLEERLKERLEERLRTDKSTEEERKEIRKKMLQQEREKALQGLEQIFETALHSGNITIDDLLLLKKGRHLEWLGDYCLNTRQEVQQFWRLYPQYDDEQWNQRAVLLQIFLLQGWKTRSELELDGELLYPQGPMSFAIKVLLPCWIAASYDLIDEGLIQLKRLLGIGNTERHVYMGIRTLAYKLQGDQESWSRCGSGYVRVDDSVIIEWNKPLGWFCRRVFSQNKGLASYADILLALARLVDVLKEGHEVGVLKEGHEKVSGSYKLENLFKLFIQNRVWELHSQLENNHCYTLLNKASKLKFNVEQVDDGMYKNKFLLTSEFSEPKIDFFEVPIKSILNSDLNNNKIFKQCMLNWIKAMKNLKSEDILPPRIIGRFWVRFMSNLDYIHIDIKANQYPEIIKQDDSKKLEHVIKCWIKAFLSALVIEEVIFIKGDLDHSINIEHVRLDDDEIFKTILNRGRYQQVQYAAAWICCPLFLAFFQDDDKKEIIRKYFLPNKVPPNAKGSPWKEFREIIHAILP